MKRRTKWQAFWRGFARAFDLFGVIPIEIPKPKKRSPRTVEEALRSDWNAVAGDFNRVFGDLQRACEQEKVSPISLDQDSREV